MPLKTHRVLFQSFENSFKREDALRWLVDFVRETELLRPISLENAAVLLDKLIQLNIISQVGFQHNAYNTDFLGVPQTWIWKTTRSKCSTSIKGTKFNSKVNSI